MSTRPRNPGFRPILSLLAVLLLIRVALAVRLQLFGDEAFYWQAGQQLALAYSDLPFLTALLAAMGSAVIPGHYLGVRLLFLVLGVVTPFLVYRVAKDSGSNAPWTAMGISLCMPLLAINGTLALPEVPLLFAALLFICGGVRLIRSEGGEGWVLAGLGGALGLATHYRFLVVLAAACVFLAGTKHGRALLRRKTVWFAVAIAALGLIPLVWFNLVHEFGALRFQFVDRHPWSFQPRGLLQPVVQMLVVTPPLFIALMLSLVHGIRQTRQGNAVAAFLTITAIVPLLVFFGVGLWADLDRTSFHWPLVAYLPLLVMLPDALVRWRERRGFRVFAWSVPLVALAGSLLFLSWLAVATLPGVLERHSTAKWFPANFVGWRAAGDRTRRWLNDMENDGVLLADNFMLAAELDFELSDVSVGFVLDNPLNRKHGRALQLRIWGRDESALESAMPIRALLVAEISAVEFQDRPAWLRRFCELFPGVELLDELVLYRGRKRFLFLRVAPEGICHLPSFAYLDTPLAGARIGGRVPVGGWAFNDTGGVGAVELLVNGERVSLLDYGLPYPGVQGVFPESTDPNHPDVGFAGHWDTAGLAPGEYELAIRVRSLDGGTRLLEQRVVVVQAE